MHKAKKISGIILILTLGFIAALTLLACNHEHKFNEWQCISPEGTPCDQREYEQKCDCGETLNKKGEHKWSETYSFDGVNHWYECEGCGAKNIGVHNVDDNGECVVCTQQVATAGLMYELNENGESYAVTGYSGEEETVIVPSKYKGKPVTIVGESAFESCVITSIELPDSITEIRDGAFAYSDLESIEILASVVSISENAFVMCGKLSNIAVSDNNSVYKSIEQNLYTKDEKTLLQYAIGKNESSFDVPESVTRIGLYAFAYSQNLQTIKLPDTLESIGDFAFYYCSNLEYNEYDYGKYLGSTDNPYLVFVKVSALLQGACEINSSTKFIMSNAFEGCYGIENVEISDSVKTMGYEVFYNCPKLTGVIIGKGLESMGDRAFFGCKELASITVDGDNNVYKSIDGNLYTKDGKKLIQYAVGKTESTFDIPDSVEIIGDYAFAYCESLTDIEIPDSVEIIGDYAFVSCESLTDMQIPDSVTSIGSSAFCYCSELKTVVIGNGVKTLGDSVFNQCLEISSITVAQNNAAYKSIDGNLYSKDGTIMIFYACGKSDTEFVLPDSVEIISDYAFYASKSLERIVLSDNLTTIGDYAFEYCDSLANVEIPDSVVSIGNYTFSYCYALTSIVIGDGVKSIDKSVFYNCYRLTDVVIGDSVTSIGDNAFSECYALTSIEIPDSVVSIGGYAFSFCYALTSVEIPDSVVSIGEYAFSYCESLTDIQIPGGVDIVANGLFCGCQSLASIEIPDSVESIGIRAFYDCQNLTDIVIGHGVKSIANSVFYNIENLTSVYYEGSEIEWSLIEIESYNEPLTAATIYYYSETEPTEEGNYWRYDDNGKIVVW